MLCLAPEAARLHNCKYRKSPVAPPANLLRLDQRLTVLCKQRPELQEALNLQRDIIRTQLTAPRPPHVSPFALPRRQLEARVRGGVPLLHDQPVAIDIHFAADLFDRLLNALSPRFDSLAAAATEGRLDPERLFGEAFVQHVDHVAEIARLVDVDPDLLSAAATLAIAPVLRAYAARLEPLLDQLDDCEAWGRGYCPICGGWPLLGELRGTSHAAWLRCAACGSGWPVQHAACPYCGNSDEQTLGTLTIEGESRFRANVCQRCKGYLKVGTAFDPPPAEVLAVDDVAGLQLDLTAIERGYQRPPGSGYRIESAVPDTSDWTEERA
jgi:FdhE protein